MMEGLGEAEVGVWRGGALIPGSVVAQISMIMATFRFAKDEYLLLFANKLS